MRRKSLTDRVIEQIDQGVRTCFAPAPASTADPAGELEDAPLSEEERRHAAGLMRINHTGEVCAQALYFGQSATTRNEAVRQHLLTAAAEEGEHLAWCERRLAELDDRPSRLNGFWYLGSFSLGALAGLAGDDVSLGFVSETERQVEAHLHEHLERLPAGDERSRAVVRQMAADEARHGLQAREAGGVELPEPVRVAMRYMADLMKFVVYRY